MKQMRTQSEKRPVSLFLFLALCMPFIVQCQAVPGIIPADSDTTMPSPREVTKDEQAQLNKIVADRFKEKLPVQSTFQAAGPFRFVTTEDILYSDRTDLGSVAFERSKYGVSEKQLDPGERVHDIEVR